MGLQGINAKDVSAKTAEVVQLRRLDAASRMHAAERMLAGFWSTVLISFTVSVNKAREAAISQANLEKASTALPVALKASFQSSKARKAWRPGKLLCRTSK